MYIVKARITKIPETQTTRLQPVYRQLPASGDAELLIDPSYFLQQKMKIEGVKIYLLRIRLSSLTKICTHLDGSLEGHGRLSWVFLQRRGRTFRKGHGIILVCSPKDRVSKKISILVDNQTAVRVLKTGKTFSMLRTSHFFRDDAQKTTAEV